MAGKKTSSDGRGVDGIAAGKVERIDYWELEREKNPDENWVGWRIWMEASEFLEDYHPAYAHLAEKIAIRVYNFVRDDGRDFDDGMRLGVIRKKAYDVIEEEKRTRRRRAMLEDRESRTCPLMSSLPQPGAFDLIKSILKCILLCKFLKPKSRAVMFRLARGERDEAGLNNAEKQALYRGRRNRQACTANCGFNSASKKGLA